MKMKKTHHVLEPFIEYEKRFRYSDFVYKNGCLFFIKMTKSDVQLFISQMEEILFINDIYKAVKHIKYI